MAASVLNRSWRCDPHLSQNALGSSLNERLIYKERKLTGYPLNSQKTYGPERNRSPDPDCGIAMLDQLLSTSVNAFEISRNSHITSLES